MIDYPHKNLDEWLDDVSTYNSAMCYPNFTTSNFVAISIFMKKEKKEKKLHSP